MFSLVNIFFPRVLSSIWQIIKFDFNLWVRFETEVNGCWR